MKDKSLEFNESIGRQGGCKASYQWIFNVYKRSAVFGANAHGEAVENSDEEYHQIIVNWKPVFWDEIRKKKIAPSRIYNGNKLGLFYAKLPNRVYVLKEKSKEISEAKQMKETNRVTLMFCTVSDGQNVPHSVIGKSKNPCLFRLFIVIRKELPMAYNHQNNAWFYIDVSLYYTNLLCSSLPWI